MVNRKERCRAPRCTNVSGTNSDLIHVHYKDNVYSVVFESLLFPHRAPRCLHPRLDLSFETRGMGSDLRDVETVLLHITFLETETPGLRTQTLERYVER